LTSPYNILKHFHWFQSYTAEVLYCPLFAAQLLEDVFVIPSFADLTTPLVVEKTNLETHDKVSNFFLNNNKKI
jgi:hypothetical protein